MDASDREVPDTQCVRLVTAFDTTEEEINAAATAFETGLRRPI